MPLWYMRHFKVVLIPHLSLSPQEFFYCLLEVIVS